MEWLLPLSLGMPPALGAPIGLEFIEPGAVPVLDVESSLRPGVRDSSREVELSLRPVVRAVFNCCWMQVSRARAKLRAGPTDNA